MRSIADGMRWPLALEALLLALIGFWSVRDGSSPGPSGVIQQYALRVHRV